MPRILASDWEYAGFRYAITESKGQRIATPLAGEPWQANRWKHRSAALADWEEHEQRKELQEEALVSARTSRR